MANAAYNRIGKIGKHSADLAEFGPELPIWADKSGKIGKSSADLADFPADLAESAEMSADSAESAPVTIVPERAA